MEALDLIFRVIVLEKLQGPFLLFFLLLRDVIFFTEFSFQRALAIEYYAFVFIQL